MTDVFGAAVGLVVVVFGDDDDDENGEADGEKDDDGVPSWRDEVRVRCTCGASTATDLCEDSAVHSEENIDDGVATIDNDSSDGSNTGFICFSKP